ncbi:hypothetical protein JZ751_025508, partial [Albula glossodonta]
MSATLGGLCSLRELAVIVSRQAREAIKEAERCDPDSIFTQFSVYKIAILENNVERGEVALPWERKSHSLFGDVQIMDQMFPPPPNAAVKAMGWLAQGPVRSEDKLLLAQNTASNLLSLAAQIALERVSQPNGPHPCPERHSEDANWFRKIAWNSALQCESSPDRMRDFFVLSYQGCAHGAEDLPADGCGGLSGAVQEVTPLSTTGDSSRDQTETLLLLYEFEARAKLNDTKLESVLESVLELDNVEAKTLETIAGLAMEAPAHFPLLCKKALKIALSLHRKQPQPDLLRCSQCVHSLIQLSLPSGVSEVEPRALEEAWGFYEDALAIMGLGCYFSSTRICSCSIHSPLPAILGCQSQQPKEFPELEFLWLLTRAWNMGILLYSLAQYPAAERWCSMAMGFLSHLGSLQDSYQTQVQVWGLESGGPSVVITSDGYEGTAYRTVPCALSVGAESLGK